MKPVWIVDDDESIRWVLEKALARENIPLRSFSNPDEVLSALDEEQPQVLVSDIRMPGRSGLHLLEDVKNRFPDIPQRKLRLLFLRNHRLFLSNRF